MKFSSEIGCDTLAAALRKTTLTQKVRKCLKVENTLNSMLICSILTLRGEYIKIENLRTIKLSDKNFVQKFICPKSGDVRKF